MSQGAKWSGCWRLEGGTEAEPETSGGRLGGRTEGRSRSAGRPGGKAAGGGCSGGRAGGREEQVWMVSGTNGSHKLNGRSFQAHTGCIKMKTKRECAAGPANSCLAVSSTQLPDVSKLAFYPSYCAVSVKKRWAGGAREMGCWTTAAHMQTGG